MENQIENRMENEIKIGIIWKGLGFIVQALGLGSSSPIFFPKRMRRYLIRSARLSFLERKKGTRVISDFFYLFIFSKINE